MPWPANPAADWDWRRSGPAHPAVGSNGRHAAMAPRERLDLGGIWWRRGEQKRIRQGCCGGVRPVGGLKIQISRAGAVAAKSLGILPHNFHY